MTRLVDRPVPILSKGKTDKSKRHKDGSGHHHPMGVFPIEQKVQHLAIAPSLVIFPSPSAHPKRRASKVADARGVCFFNHNRTNFLDRDRIARSQLVRYRQWINRARSLREFAQTPSNFLYQSLPIAHFFAFSHVEDGIAPALQSVSRSYFRLRAILALMAARFAASGVARPQPTTPTDQLLSDRSSVTW